MKQNSKLQGSSLKRQQSSFMNDKTKILYILKFETFKISLKIKLHHSFELNYNYSVLLLYSKRYLYITKTKCAP